MYLIVYISITYFSVNGVSAVGTGTSTSTDGTVISSVVGVTAAPSTNE